VHTEHMWHRQGTSRQVLGLRTKRAHAGRDIVRANKEVHAHTKDVVDIRFCLRLWWCWLCVEHACTTTTTKNTQGDCVWITRGVAFWHRLTAYSSSTVQVFGAGHTRCLCCTSQHASLLVAVCVLIMGDNVWVCTPCSDFLADAPRC